MMAENSPVLLIVIFYLAICANAIEINCGGRLTGQAGSLSSPNIGGNYPNNAYCVWNITVATGQVIDLRFKTLDLDRTGDQSCKDYVEVYDGRSENDLRLGGRYCGFSSDSGLAAVKIRSSSNVMLVTFKSDDRVTRTGFTASYWAHDCPPFMYGDEKCNTSCICHKNNTNYCDNFDGQCYCKNGWMYSDCSVLQNYCTEPNTCPGPYSKCTSLPGGHDCVCPIGMTLEDDRCIDSATCTKKNCSHACGVTSDNPRIETCYCPKGMKLNSTDNSTCFDCGEGRYGEDCRYTCNCDRINSISCNKSNGLCNCHIGWQGPTCVIDVNECTLMRQPCNSSVQCYNTWGSYQCLCLPGYEKTSADSECTECGQVLNETFGTIISGRHAEINNLTKYVECSWTIKAPIGEVVSLSFQYFDLYGGCSFNSYLEIYDIMNDTSSLLENVSSPFQKRIIRTKGNEMKIFRIPARCSSWYGYQSAGFNATYWTHSCDPFMYNANCSEPCRCVQNNTERCNSTTAECICKSGWIGTYCDQDVNECHQSKYSVGLCPDYSNCLNLPGSYECRCKEGLMMSLNNTCIINNDLSTVCNTRNCSHVCVSVFNNQTASSTEQCYCPVGMELDGDQCIDCRSFKFGPDCQWDCDCEPTKTKLCDPVTGRCDCWKNWTGSYCSEDVNECNMQTYSCQPHSHCVNSYGGYQCICTGKDGYLTDENGTCYHLDCTYELNNGAGDILSPQFASYYVNNANCSWNITVRMKQVISLWFPHFYTETDNSCQSDYMEVFDGIDESSRLIGHYCGSGVPNVIRTSGNHMYVVFRSDEKSYYTGKIIGTYKSHECHSFTYGIQSCENSCQCVKENTDLCINTNGECVCKPGWMSRDCSMDVNECQGINKQICPPNSECINTIGSYICKCYLGFVQDSANQSCYESKECIIKQCSHSCHVLRPGVEECLCPKGMELDAVTGLVCYVPLYPYGTNNGDLLLEDTSFQLGFKNISRPIYLTSGAPFGEFIKTSVHVSSNGAFGFGDGTFNYGFFSNIHISIKEESIIAPYMTNINPESGRVFYHLYDNWGEKFADAKFKQDSPKMNQVVARSVNDIKEYYKLNDFEVDFVFITTWENVQPLLLPSIIKETNTFQAVYICGWEVQNGELVGEKTGYVIFLYPYGYMKWSYVVGRLVTVGISGSQSSLASLSVIVSQLDRVQGNKGYDGVISYEVGRVPSNRMCYNYLYKNINLLNDGRYGDEKDELYKCPTTLERQGAQWELYYDSTFVSPDGVEIHCFAIKPIAKHQFLAKNRRNKLCCYKQMKSSTEQWDEWYRNYREAFYMSGHVLIADPKEYISLVQQNILAEQECCADGRDSKSCNRFYKIFPDMGSTDFAEFVTASALGDPHITTLDGLNYTANVWGEYILLEIPSENFTLQARTERYETSDGVVTNATVFTAFVARESNESFFQAELYYSNKSMVLFANGIDITRKFYSSDFVTEILSDQYLSVMKEKQSNKTLVVVSFPCGVTIKVYTAFKSLLIEVNAMETLMNKTQGLLGNFNKNISDDFTLPNGTILPISSSEKEIYEHFAQEWRVTPSNSLFQYEEGKSATDYQHDNFTPFFSSSIDLSDKEKAEEFCGSNHHSCVFDYLVTRNQAFSLYTKHVTEENAIVHTNIENHPPTIKVPNNTFDSNGNWLVYQGTPSTLQVLCEDIDQDEIIYELLGDPLGVTINKAGLLTYRPDYNQTISLSFRAKDSKGSYSPVLNIPISICSLCNGHGVCDSKTTRKQSADGLFQIQVCECYPAYTGAYCDTEIDACALSPCFKGQTCTDLSAAEQGNNSVGYRCGQCPLGYKPYLQACVDIDECNETRPCEQKCTNTEGSFLCSCSEGYRLSYEDQSTCIDINECEERTSKCHQICNNTEGNYTCDCYPFYTLDTDGFTCNLDGDKTEVRYHCQHIYAVGSFSNNCTCRLGYDRKPEDPTFCIDVNECEYGNKPCSQNCVNLEGSYECSCFVGYQLNVDGVSCEACQEPYYGKNCSYICQCNGRGICDPVRGCLCNSQWTVASCEKDVDECAQPHACKEGMLCINTLGAFKCVCPHGYKLENGVCIDLNECQESLGNMTCDMKTEMCINNLGSYTCECKSGFSRNNMSTCVDIDECEKEIDQCEHSCQNVPGTYNCQCNFGYILAEDRQTCNRVKNVCQTHNLSCSYGCKLNHYNLMECYCPKGYQLDSLGQCEDVNECNSETENLCADASLCTNTNGSFTCSCRPGFKLDNDNRSCIACHPSTWGPNCANSCACQYGTDHCSPVTGCVCKQGYTGNQCNIDIDECVTGQKKCEINEKCMNVPGTATCMCQDGFQRINGSCEDIDECRDILTNNCSQQCSNYAGGFTCSCYLGFSFNDGLCQDIDECKLGKAKCEQICVNTEGSYRCTCNPGLVLQTDGLTCKTKVECDKSNNCSYKCSVMNGTDQCYCPKGKTLAQDLNNCDDVNLCEHSHCTFECAETDSNTSYTCMCGLGQYLASNGIDCLDCVEGKWGPLCANTCNCTAVNTLRCDRLSGSCQCKSGWSGPQCEKDIDECVQGLADCSANSRCQNIDGGYVCTCIDGFVKNQTNGVYQECDSNFYGPSCAYNCSCGDKSLCNKVNGSCYCVPEWTGDNCNQDIDECVRGIHTCDERKYEKCQNTPGGYQCTCMEGYLRGCDSCLCGAIKNHDLTIVFNYNAASLNLDDKFSNDYKTTVTQVQIQLEISLKSSMNSIISVTVISIRKGSLIVDYSVVLNATLEHESNKSFHAVLRDILDKGVILFEKPVSVLDITSDGYQVTNSTCMCRDTEECIVGSDTTICRNKEEKKDLTNLIIGLAVGIPIFLAVCVTIIVVCLHCKKTAKTYEVKSSSGGTSDRTKIMSIKENNMKYRTDDNVYDNLYNDDL